MEEMDTSRVNTASSPISVTTSHQCVSSSKVEASRGHRPIEEHNEPNKRRNLGHGRVVTVEEISGTTQTGPLTSLPNMMGKMVETCSATDSLEYHKTERRDSESMPLYKKFQNSCRPIADFLEELEPADLEKYLVPAKFLRCFWVMDIVRPHFRNSCCFTKR